MNRSSKVSVMVVSPGLFEREMLACLVERCSGTGIVTTADAAGAKRALPPVEALLVIASDCEEVELDRLKSLERRSTHRLPIYRVEASSAQTADEMTALGQRIAGAIEAWRCDDAKATLE